MLVFPCPCGRRLGANESRAGTEAQCPHCGRLLTIPGTDELREMDDSGAFRLAEDDAPVPRRDLAREVPGGDRRLTAEQLLAAGAVATIPTARPARFDPETNELVTDMPLADAESRTRNVVPVEGPAAPRSSDASGHRLHYANNATERVLSLPRLWLEMFQPGNAFVLLTMFAAHVGLAISLGLPTGFLLLGAIFVVALLFLCLAHYGAIVEDTGYEERDDLPAPLRSLSLGEDIFKPAVNVVFSVGLFIVPALVLWLRVEPSIGQPAALVLLALGFVFAPVILLTVSTSGTLVNLAPLRVMRTAGVCGASYVYVVLLTLIGLPLLVGGTVVMMSAMAQMTEGALQVLPTLPSPGRVVAVMLPTIVTGTYFCHLATWSLGLLYRRHHVRFPWLLQHHVSTRKEDPIKKLEAYHRQQAARKGVDPDQRNEAALQHIRTGDRVRAASSERRDAGLPTS